MVIVAFGLVLAAAASFAAGIAMSRTSDTLVYISIAFSLAAFLILAIASLRARQTGRESPEAEAEADWATTRLRSLDTDTATGPLLEGLDATQLDMAPSWKREARQAWRAAEPALDDELEEQLEAEEEEADFEVPLAPLASDAASFEDRGWGIPDEEEAHLTDEVEFDEVEFAEDVLDVQAEVEPVADIDALDPIDDYDDLTAAEILPQLHDLDLDGLRWVRQRERSGAERATVLNQVEQLIVEHGGAPAKRAARKTSAARKKTAKTAKTAKSAKATKSTKKTAPARRASKSSRGR